MMAFLFFIGLGLAVTFMVVELAEWFRRNE